MRDVERWIRVEAGQSIVNAIGFVPFDLQTASSALLPFSSIGIAQMVLRTDNLSHQRLGVFRTGRSQVKRESFEAVVTCRGGLEDLRDGTAISRSHSLEPEPLRPYRPRIRSERRSQLFVGRNRRIASLTE